MNLHGYKKKAKAIAELIRLEEDKKDPSKDKIYRLKKARRKIYEKIKKLKKKEYENEKRRINIWRKKRN